MNESETWDLTEGTSSANWRGCVPPHYVVVVVSGQTWHMLDEVAFNYHWGDKQIDADSPAWTRAEIVALRSAAATSQQAFDVAMVNTSAAQWYTDTLAECASKNVPTLQAVGNVCRRWFQVAAVDVLLG